MKITTIIRLLILTVLAVATFNANAKSIGRFSKYLQVTDKEVLVETSKGIKVLFTAYDNQSIGVKYFGKDEVCPLISPANILQHHEFNGSIYVEEIDELMQITTTTKTGLMIKIDKRKCNFTFVDKSTNNELVFGEDQKTGLISNKQTLSFLADTSNSNGYSAQTKM
jgi:hypothetical protein